MLQLFLSATLQFTLHFLIGFVLVLGVAWLCRRLIRRWLAAGAGLPRWLLVGSTILVWTNIGLSAALTGAQTGTIAVLSRLIEQESKGWTEQAIMLAARPIGIESADQEFGPDKLKELADRIAPGMTQKGLDYLAGQDIVGKVEATWQKLPEFVRHEAVERMPQSHWSVRDLVDLSYRELVSPAVASGKFQAQVFAYGLAAVLILCMQGLDLLLRWWSRRPDAPKATPAA